MTVGTIKTKTDKGFGFIAVEGSEDVFVHNSACNGQFDSWPIGQAVQFDIEKNEKGLRAVNVTAAKAGGAVTPKSENQAEDASAPDMSMAA
ncbi:MAG: cold shock domain-containing protein [Candidatus Peribacteraceae bacterium]|nr:cold shock domain-containing protein [Candidatus Peribacteraceae bacterium]